VTPAEPTAKIRSPRTGIFATLCAHLPAKGTGAPSPRRASIALSAALALTALAFTAGPALAATSPTVTIKAPSGATATTVQLSGTVNPNGSLTTTSWIFQYAKDAETEGWTPSTVSGVALASEEVSGTLEGLQPNASYEVRLVAANEEGGEGVSAEPNPKFTTLAAPPTIVSESTSNVKATEATLEGVVNPNNQVTECHFQYGLASGAVSEHEVPCSPEFVKGFGEQSVTPMKLNEKGESVPAPITGLEPGQAYRYRIVAKNGKGEESTGPVREFKKLVAPPEKPETDAAETITNTTAVLHGVVNPSGPSSVSWFFRYAAGSSCSAAGASTTPAQGPEEVQAHSAEANVTGLQPGAQYTACLIAENEAKEKTVGNEISFTTMAVKPTVTEQSISSVNSTEATLSAQINAEGTPTTYKVEYGTSEPYASSSEASLPAAEGSVGVLAHLTGLTPSSEYHFRFVATSELGTSSAATSMFTTSASTGVLTSSLPDERAYELVSTAGEAAEAYAPEQKNASEEDLTTRRLFQASGNGQAIAYVGAASSVTGNGDSGEGVGNEWLATRSEEGWKDADITPAATARGTFFEAFSSDLKSWILRWAAPESGSLPPLAPGAPPECRFVLYSQPGGGTYQPMFTTTKVPGSALSCGRPHFAGASGDDSHILFQTEAPLTEEAEQAEEAQKQHSSFEERCVFSCNLYDSTGGRLQLVNVLPGPEHRTVPNSTFGGPSDSENPPDLSGVISADGSRVFWTDTQPGVDFDHLYLRERGTITVPVSLGAAKFWTASPDGRYAFYTEGEKLYRFNADTNTRELLAGEGLAHEIAGVQGVLGVNQTGEDGAYVYFVATGVLTATKNANEEEAAQGRDNLYLLHNGQPSFIGSLSPLDNGLEASGYGNGEQYGDWQPDLGSRTAEVTPDGRYLLFESVQPLTRYNNVKPNKGPEVEVFTYAADTRETACASCNPDGLAPQVSVPAELQSPLAASASDTHMRRWVTDDGSRVFFATPQPLVHQDTNGLQDVYEWERDGTGSCRSSSGCVYLLSGGHSSSASYFVEADPLGDNAFFTHRGKIDGFGPLGEETELYDARVHGGFPQTSLACTGPECQSAGPLAPSVVVPSSSVFSGSGNFAAPAPSTSRTKSIAQLRREKLVKALRVCRKHKAKRRRAACERTAHKRYGNSRSTSTSLRRSR
jgi:hypothetical protein